MTTKIVGKFTSLKSYDHTMYMWDNFTRYGIHPEYINFIDNGEMYFSWFDGAFIIEVDIEYIVIWHSYADYTNNGIFYGNDSLLRMDQIDDSFMCDLVWYLAYIKNKKDNIINY